MSARKLHSCLFTVTVLACVGTSQADSTGAMVRDGNGLYADGKYTEAINKYNEALVERPEALRPKFNKSKDMSLVAKSKYNLGNCFFQRGAKQRDSDLNKALEDMKTSITHWRQVLDIEPTNEKAARNIEVARLTIKDILDQLKKQQEQQQQDQQGQQQQDQGQQQSQPSSQDPNQPQDPNQAETPPPEDPNEPQDEPKPDQQQPTVVPDMTAQEILDREQRQKEQRQILQRGQTRPVEKDW